MDVRTRLLVLLSSCSPSVSSRLAFSTAWVPQWMIKRSLSRRALVSWILLVVLRLLVALTSTSSIHPDEHFQNPEIAAADVFGYPGLLRTWEWLGDMPCRSIVPVWGSTGLAFSLLRLVVGDGE